MLKTYRGRYEKGKFVFPEFDEVPLPDNVNVIITVLDDADLKPQGGPVYSDEDKRKAALKFLEAMEKLEKELTDEDHAAIDELQSGKYKPVFEERL